LADDAGTAWIANINIVGNHSSLGAYTTFVNLAGTGGACDGTKVTGNNVYGAGGVSKGIIIGSGVRSIQVSNNTMLGMSIPYSVSPGALRGDYTPENVSFGYTDVGAPLTNPLNLPNKGAIAARNAGNSAWIKLLELDGSDHLVLSPSGKSISIDGGILQGGRRVKHLRGSINCATAAVIGSTCSSSWQLWSGSAFPDNNYSVVCTLEKPSGVPVISSVAKTSTAIQISVTALSNKHATGYYNCVALHD
jgi:hypothetical protein